MLGPVANFIYVLMLGIGVPLHFFFPFTHRIVMLYGVIYYILLSLFVILEVALYTIAISADHNDIDSDVVYYMSELFSNTYSIFSSSFGFIFRVFLLLLTGVGNIYFINICGYFPIFSIKLNSNGNPYTAEQAFEESAKLAKHFSFTLIFVNTFITIIFYTLYLSTPYLPKFKDINVTMLLKTIFIDSIFVYYIHTGYSLQKYEKSIREMEDKMAMATKQIMRAGSEGRMRL